MHAHLMTLEQAADLLQLHPRTVVAKARSGQLPGAKLGGSWRFWKPSIEAVLTGRPWTPDEADGDPEWVNTTRAAELLGTTRQTILNLVTRGQLPAGKVAGQWRVHWWRVRDAIAAGEDVAAPWSPRKGRR